MSSSSPLSRPKHTRWGSAYVSFAGDRHGIAAVEFTLFLPILLALLYGGAELVNAIDHQRKVNQAARTLADLTSQGDSQNPMSTKLMQDVLASAKPVLAPYSTTGATMQISAIGVYSGKTTKAYVCSTWPTMSVTRLVGTASDLTVPTNYQRAGARYVIAEVKMPYVPILGAVAPNFIKGLVLNFNWSETVAWPVRGGSPSSSSTDAEVVLPSGKACP